MPPADPVIEVFRAEILAEMRIEAAHQRKANKYAHFLTDICDYSVNVKPFEVGTHTGYINNRNKASLTNIHKCVKKKPCQ